MLADRGVLSASTSASFRIGGSADVELPVLDDEPAGWSQHPDPLVDGSLGVRECPEQVTADDEVEAAGVVGKLLGIRLLESNRGAARRRLATSLHEHRRREVD